MLSIYYFLSSTISFLPAVRFLFPAAFLPVSNAVTVFAMVSVCRTLSRWVRKGTVHTHVSAFDLIDGEVFAGFEVIIFPQLWPRIYVLQLGHDPGYTLYPGRGGVFAIVHVAC